MPDTLFMYMAKNFAEWHKFKARLDSRKKLPTFSEGEIWWCSTGVNVGTEEDGKNSYFERPVIILRRFNSGMFLAVELTSKIKTGQFYYSLKIKETIKTVILSQLRTLSAKRLQRPIGKTDPDTFKKIKLAAGIL